MNETLRLLAVPAVLFIAWRLGRRVAADDVYTSSDSVDLAASEVEAFVIPDTPSLADMSTSEAGALAIKRREGCTLTAITLGDGGSTIGYGHYTPFSLSSLRSITLSQAEAIFEEDLVSRGERWVKKYVTVDLEQNQFDALVSMAYNLKPSSFAQIADAINNGEDPAPVALQFTRPGTNLENGLRNRRYAELSLFENGTYV